MSAEQHAPHAARAVGAEPSRAEGPPVASSVSTGVLVGLALQPALAATVTFGLFGNGWPTFVVCLSLQTAWVVFAWRRGWLG